MKSKYPVPIIDELLDELFGDSWFSILDLHAGFHQILLKEGEAYKTTFQTQLGHYEFRVMVFGLTGNRAHSRKHEPYTAPSSENVPLYDLMLY